MAWLAQRTVHSLLKQQARCAMDRRNDAPMFAPRLVMRKVVRDVDSAPAAGGAPPIETLRYSLGECPWVPDLEVFEEGGRLAVHVDLPGMKREDISISVADGCVHVAGERRRAARSRKELHAPEPTYGRFHRAVPLPDACDVDRMTWVVENGVLQISVPVIARIQRELWWL